MKTAFLSLETVTNALAFTLGPSQLGQLKKEETKEETFYFEPCYDKDSNFIGFAVEKRIIYKN